MNYYTCIYYRGENPQGRAYLFKYDGEFKPGDIVELSRGKKAIVSGIVKEEDVDYDPEKIQAIVGIWKEKTDEQLG